MVPEKKFNPNRTIKHSKQRTFLSKNNVFLYSIFKGAALTDVSIGLFLNRISAVDENKEVSPRNICYVLNLVEIIN